MNVTLGYSGGTQVRGENIGINWRIQGVRTSIRMDSLWDITYTLSDFSYGSKYRIFTSISWDMTATTMDTIYIYMPLVSATKTAKCLPIVS